MSPKRLLQNTFVILYLFLTASIFLYTMVRVEIPWIPERVHRFFYGMMAPYQGYKTQNFDLLAEGLRAERSEVRGQRSETSEEQWEKIDLDPYYPMILGNQIMYRRLRSFHEVNEEISKKKYTELAELLLKHERERGRAYEAMRLTWQQWPVSLEGYEAKQGEAVNYLLAQTE